jgi:hypothetical protein
MTGCILLAAATVLSPAADIVFSRPDSLRIMRGAWQDGTEERISYSRSGAEVRFDRRKLKDGSETYYALSPSLSFEPDWRWRRISLFVRFGDAPAVKPSLSLEFCDAEGEHFRYKPVAIVRDGPAARLDYRIDEYGTCQKPWGRKSNGRFDGSLRLSALLGSYVARVDSGTLVYERLSVFGSVPSPRAVNARTCSASAEDLAFDVDTGDPLHLVRDGEAAPEMVFCNRSGETRRWRGKVLFRDHFGRGFDQFVDVSAASGSVVRVGVERALPYRGIWYVTADLVGDDGQPEVVGTRFACMVRHGVTPVLPKPHFRMGINFHAQKYWDSPVHFAKTLDALVASGAKLVRSGGFKFADVARRPTYDWTMTDAIFNALRSRGFSINANVYPGSGWARKPMPEEVRARKHRHIFNYPSRPRLFREFCAAIAARYGTGIDYYEIGNEWDLTSSEVLPPDEAMRLIREGHEGIKRSCPAATVATCGWAGADSQAYTPAKNPGLIELFAGSAQDAFDVWAIHLHGPFGSYADRLQNDFFPMRERTGLVRKPWYSNESALATAGGQEGVAARAVWQKILYAMAWGSTDYVWYTLRATGPDPEASEDSYGLLTLDYKPRATFVAFAALAPIVHDTKFGARLVEEGGRYAYRLDLSGGRGFALVGWDDSAGGRADVLKIETDARSAKIVDLMGNSAEVPVSGGVVSWPLSRDPSALMLENATRAVPLSH